METRLQQLCEAYHMPFFKNVLLGGHTTFQIGGKADFWIEINSVEGLSAVLRFCHETGTPHFVMGKGSNVLASDEGYRGVILHLGKEFSGMSVQENHILVCQSGAMLSSVANMAAKHQLSGMEAISGIPGSVGGALCMNAGAYQREMKDIVLSCDYLDASGNLHTLQRNDLNLSYRHSFFTEHSDCIICSVKIQLQPDNSGAIRARMSEYAECRKSKQPLNYPSAGSTFKRPKGDFASRLIDLCGLKGFRVGGAQVSEKHAGFVININRATCEEVLRLCGYVQNKVLEKTGYILELEPVLLGIQQEDFLCN